MNIPAELRYSEDHEWIKVIDGNIALIGISDFAQSELGDIVFVDINTVGDKIKAHDVFGSVEAVKTVSDLFSPVSGTVLELNSELEGNPQFLNDDPYDKGWIVKIEVDNLADIEALLSADDYKKLINH
jgi:glycine cleavage system H protein